MAVFCNHRQIEGIGIDCCNGWQERETVHSKLQST
jgi:hypothetical protein